MAKVLVSAAVLSDLVSGFTAHRVDILGVEFDAIQQVFVFEIAGLDVPDVAEVTAIAQVQQNRAGDKLRTMTFKDCLDGSD